MIPKECKRLAEVEFPIQTVSKHAVHEQEQHDAHPKVLHMWWARRPLAACRAMLLALLLPDPCDPECPEAVKVQARRLLAGIQGAVGPSDADLRAALLRFLGDFSNWGLAASPAWLEAACGLVHASHSNAPPVVIDPFAGGGAIPLRRFASGVTRLPVI